MNVNPRAPAISLAILISFFLHLTIFTVAAAPDYSIKKTTHEILSDYLKESGISRDIIANINQDDIRDIKDRTLLSDRDSTARGYITKTEGDRWLNNSLDFKLLSGGGSVEESAAPRDNTETVSLLHSMHSDFTVFLEKFRPPAPGAGMKGLADIIRIPDKNDISRENAIFYSNHGTFSFNTEKFQNYQYFKNMKDRIASNWFPPPWGNVVLRGYPPGESRILAIQSQVVITFFIINRDGDILNVEVLSSRGRSPLALSCVDAIKNSLTFGTVPEDIEGEVIGIPFVFEYHSR